MDCWNLWQPAASLCRDERMCLFFWAQVSCSHITSDTCRRRIFTQGVVTLVMRSFTFQQQALAQLTLSLDHRFCRLMVKTETRWVQVSRRPRWRRQGSVFTLVQLVKHTAYVLHTQREGHQKSTAGGHQRNKRLRTSAAPCQTTVPLSRDTKHHYLMNTLSWIGTFRFSGVSLTTDKAGKASKNTIKSFGCHF